MRVRVCYEQVVALGAAGAELWRVGGMNGMYYEADAAQFDAACARRGLAFTGVIRFVPELPLKWPAWAKIMAKHRVPKDRGVGDTAERLFGLAGGSQFKSAFRAMGFNCGCARRHQDWNQRFPYG